ncbi:BRISC complex subunit FAM175B-like [Daktulosphaira vitifoliae]|uniref:BRISC complex subunit FAM175B-like n=1 Tax=Daktulosphaira vitifoliae TaxID=58002 RepID=UPI0021A98F21|nr:BRISC complex subunit FAM175B-like [Daktulosphaira vitifoliae]XP_050529182.1 BRISC complex subunit FAM175B-like [Daktulosphaira vitifoliae]XP_050529183.1 BRISC complex subunit FAM175B-like [Daktulosphaira vitifoliae]
MSQEYYDLRFVVTTPTLAITQYNCQKEPYDQIGFLIGEKNVKVSNIITDESLNNTITEETICIHASYPVPDFYELMCVNSLKLDFKKLKNFLQKGPDNFEKSVIGWYHFRRNSVLNPSINDECFHMQLSYYFDKISVSKNKFLFCILNHDFNESMIHKFNHIFFKSKFRKCLMPVKVDIVNLSTKPFIESDNLGYKTNINLISNCKSYSNIIHKVFGQRNDQCSKAIIYKMRNALIEEMEKMVKRIVANEQEMIKLRKIIEVKKREIGKN